MKRAIRREVHASGFKIAVTANQLFGDASAEHLWISGFRGAGIWGFFTQARIHRRHQLV